MTGLNPRLRDERARKRKDLLQATEAILEDLARSVRRPGSQLRGRDRINRRAGREANRHKVEKRFTITVTDDDLTWKRNDARIHADTKIYARPPAEADVQTNFRVTLPPVRPVVLALRQARLIEWGPGRARSTRVLVDPEPLPELPCARREPSRPPRRVTGLRCEAFPRAHPARTVRCSRGSPARHPTSSCG